jgi:ribosomal protein S18 acetylase RimI-like enzyme
MLLSAACNIRPAAAADLETLVDFNCRLAEETEAKALDRHVLRAGVARVLQDNQLGRYFVAECAPLVPSPHGGTVAAPATVIAGQLMLTTEWSDWRNGLFWWIQSVYVLPEYRRRGVLRALFEHVAALARHDPAVCGLRLYVERRNQQAQAAYERLGMRPAGYLVYEWARGPAASGPAGA